MRLRERAAGVLDSSTEVGRAALDLYCWYHPPTDLLTAAAAGGFCLGLAGGFLLWVAVLGRRRPT